MRVIGGVWSPGPVRHRERIEAQEISRYDGEWETVFYRSVRNNREHGHAGDRIQCQPTTEKVYGSERDERKKDGERAGTTASLQPWLHLFHSPRARQRP